MSLRFALLGFLSTTRASGYALGRKFAAGAGAMWEALPSQIYPELRKLEELGWVRAELDDSDQLGRRTYSVTDAGRTALRAWVESGESAHPPQRDAELVRFLFLDRSDFATIRAHAQRHRSHYLARLRAWGEERQAIARGTHERQRDRLARAPVAEHGFITGMKWFAFDGLVRRAQMEIDWAEAVLAWLDQLDGRKEDAALPLGAAQSLAAKTPPSVLGHAVQPQPLRANNKETSP